MRKNKEDVEHLIHLLKIVTKKDQNLSANTISLHCIYTHTCILNLNISQNIKNHETLAAVSTGDAEAAFLI
ncbi:hypothetical protein NC653_039146 [Populus alba x Populus x berolinensis]|uniref:Uncharacterized protein n=1 Tax=Populus alba x Populus x berolinensis TaxID=444605 RepID=A0AAD6PQ63_9ROSI|nr:hypothetical protein NC653_039146 [Populus alba x Populus x berolinensis]